MTLRRAACVHRCVHGDHALPDNSGRTRYVVGRVRATDGDGRSHSPRRGTDPPGLEHRCKSDFLERRGCTGGGTRRVHAVSSDTFGRSEPADLQPALSVIL